MPDSELFWLEVLWMTWITLRVNIEEEKYIWKHIKRFISQTKEYMIALNGYGRIVLYRNVLYRFNKLRHKNDKLGN